MLQRRSRYPKSKLWPRLSRQRFSSVTRPLPTRRSFQRFLPRMERKPSPVRLSMLQVDWSLIDLSSDVGSCDGTAKSLRLLLCRAEEGRVGGRAKDERLERLRNAKI